MAFLRILSPDAPFDDAGLVEQEVARPGFRFEILKVARAEEIPPDRLAQADAVLGWHRVRYDAGVIAKLTRCRAIMRAGVGYDHIDVEAAGAAGIAVLNTPDYGTGEVADHAMALLLALRRGIASQHDWLRADPLGPWAGRQGPLVKRLRGATLGVVGLGRIGTAFVERARPFGFRILAYDPYLPRGQEIALNVERKETLEELLQAAEIVSLHCPLNAETRGLMNADSFAVLPPGALLINTARGALVDLDACYEALRSGRLGGAALDVLPQEPPSPEHPLIRAYCAREDWLAERLILTPHAAWYAPESWADMRRLAVERLVAYLTRGDLSCVVNRPWLTRAR